MKREDVESQSDREILVDLRVSMAVIEDRTVDLPEIRQKVFKNEQDLNWMKRLGILFVSLVGIGVGAAKWLGGL